MALTNVKINWVTPNATISIDGAAAVSYTGTTANLQLSAGNHIMVLTTANETVTKNLVVPMANADRIQAGIDAWIANSPTTSEQGYFDINEVNYNDGNPYAVVYLLNSGKTKKATHVKISAETGFPLPSGIVMDENGVINNNYTYGDSDSTISIPINGTRNIQLPIQIRGLKLTAIYTDGNGETIVVDEMDVNFVLNDIPADIVFYTTTDVDTIKLKLMKPSTSYDILLVGDNGNTLVQTITSTASGTVDFTGLTPNSTYVFRKTGTTDIIGGVNTQPTSVPPVDIVSGTTESLKFYGLTIGDTYELYMYALGSWSLDQTKVATEPTEFISLQEGTLYQLRKNGVNVLTVSTDSYTHTQAFNVACKTGANSIDLYVRIIDSNYLGQRSIQFKYASTNNPNDSNTQSDSFDYINDIITLGLPLTGANAPIANKGISVFDVTDASKPMFIGKVQPY